MCLKQCFRVFAREISCPVVSAACVVVSSVSRSFNDFLQQAARDKSDGYPKSLDDLSKAGIRLVIADSNDPDSVGFVQGRVAFYVAGEDGACLNFLSLWDDFLVWKVVVFVLFTSRQKAGGVYCWEGSRVCRAE